jgi:hypothetical protein
LAVEARECGAHSPWARKACTLSDKSHEKISVIEEALRALDTKRQRHLQRRRIEMLGKQTG